MKYHRIGDYLKLEFLEKYSINQNMLAFALDVPANRIWDIVAHRRRITANTDLRLCKFFKLKEGHFLDLQSKMELAEEKEAAFDVLEKIIPYDVLRKM